MGLPPTRIAWIAPGADRPRPASAAAMPGALAPDALNLPLDLGGVVAGL